LLGRVATVCPEYGCCSVGGNRRRCEWWSSGVTGDVGRRDAGTGRRAELLLLLPLLLGGGEWCRWCW
jgi:hypothetical protein